MLSTAPQPLRLFNGNLRPKNFQGRVATHFKVNKGRQQTGVRTGNPPVPGLLLDLGVDGVDDGGEDPAASFSGLGHGDEDGLVVHAAALVALQKLESKISRQMTKKLASQQNH